jgi:hypothetical protein
MSVILHMLECLSQPSYLALLHSLLIANVNMFYLHSRSYIVKEVKQSLYTPWRRLGGEEV